MLLLLCLSLCLPGLSQENFTPEQAAFDYLTEVYGYTLKEAQKFRFFEIHKGILMFYHPDSPQWVYQMGYKNNQALYTNTPYRSNYSLYPSEGNIRLILQRLEEEQLFNHLTENKTKVRELLTQNGVTLTAQLELMLTSSQDVSLSSQDFIREFFCSCFGAEYLWTDAIRDWHDKLLLSLGHSLPPTWTQAKKGVQTSTTQSEFGGTSVVTRFKCDLPDVLRETVANEKRLAGFDVVAGALRTNYDPEGKMGLCNGFGVFEKDGQRLLMVFELIPKKEPWQWSFYPVSEKAVLDSSWDLSIDYVESIDAFRFTYQKGDTKIVVDAMPTFGMGEGCGRFALTSLRNYEAITDGGKKRLIISPGFGFAWRITEINEHKRDDFETNLWPFTDLDAYPLKSYPQTIKEAQSLSFPELPENHMITSSVNFRQKTSSRSKKLGLLHSGAILPIIDRLPGNPSDWIQTKVGDIDGYVVVTYTSLDGANASILTSRPLPVAKLKTDAPLLESVGLFAKTKAELKAGQVMHVIMDAGDWLYVVVPQGELGWFMDINGQYGYLKKDQLDVALTLPQLEWNSGL